MKIAYLHGLESDNTGPKNDWLRTIASDVYDPLINYKEKGIYKRILDEIREFGPDLILGSSMGGYFASRISKALAIPAVLFNPALHSRSFEPDTKGSGGEWHNPKTLVVFGSKDDLISPEKTLELLDTSKVKTEFYDHGHRTPTKVFKDSVRKFAKSL